MQEIEIKFKINNLDNLKNKLIESGSVLSEELYQKDTVFVPTLKDTSNGEGKMFIRIRKENDKTELTLKKQSSKIMQSKEIEFEVSNYESAKDFLLTLGLEEWVTVEKRRVKTKYKGFNICMDIVTRLGVFVEVEIITEEENKTDYYENKILEVCHELGIDTKERINSFYDTMISELSKE